MAEVMRIVNKDGGFIVIDDSKLETPEKQAIIRAELVELLNNFLIKEMLENENKQQH